MSNPPTEKQAAETAEPLIGLKAVLTFVRQLSHDLRNHLNAAELQSAYIQEVAEDPELKAEIKRLREMTSSLGKALQSLTAALAPIKLTRMPYPAADFAEDLQGKVESTFPEQASSLRWNAELSDVSLEIDPQLLQQALLELFANAFRHGRGEGMLSADIRVEDERFVFTLREPKKSFDLSTRNWGHQPFHSVGHGHYGLGLHRARGILVAHGGELAAEYDQAASVLVTTATLPVSGA